MVTEKAKCVLYNKPQLEVEGIEKGERHTLLWRGLQYRGRDAIETDKTGLNDERENGDGGKEAVAETALLRFAISAEISCHQHVWLMSSAILFNWERGSSLYILKSNPLPTC